MQRDRRLRPVMHTAQPLRSWETRVVVSLHWMVTPPTPPSPSPSGRLTQSVSLSVSSQNRTWLVLVSVVRLVTRCVAFASGFACFLSRAYDQIRMGAISQTKLKLAGSHVGVSIGEDGPSQMALEDIAMFRAVNNCHVFYPSDAVSCERAVELAANIQAMCYIRTSRPATLSVYPNDEKFEIGKGKVVRESASDTCLLVGAGITLHECLKAHDELKSQGVNVRLFDPFCLKPIDAQGILSNAQACGGKIITVEDHYPEGGLGEAVCGVTAMAADVRVKRLAVTGLPRSGPPAELIDMFGISARHIVKAVKEFV